MPHKPSAIPSSLERAGAPHRESRRSRGPRVLLAGLLAAALVLSACSSTGGAGAEITSSGGGSMAPSGTDAGASSGTAASESASSEGSVTAISPSVSGSAGSTDSAGSSGGGPTGSHPGGAGATGGVGPDGCVTDFQPGTDYFPDKLSLQYAKNFTISYHDSYAVVTVSEPSPGAKPADYVLVRCGAPRPALSGSLADAQMVTVPVHSLFSGSTTHLPALVMLDRLDVLTGVASKAYISEKQVLKRVSSPSVTEYADAAGTVDAEKVVVAKPDVLITGGTDDPAYAGIEKAGIPVLSDADWLENNPLGRAEWIKFFALLTDTASAATTQFDQIADAYHQTAALVRGEPTVQVVTGQPYQGTWYVPGGGSYTATLLSDAGGTYPWAKNKSTGSIATDVETVFAKSGGAPVWLASTTWTTKKQALAENSTFAKFTAFRDNNVWNAAKDVTASGGNNFYELGAARPDLILGDLVAILHPDKMPGHDFAFYLKLS